LEKDTQAQLLIFVFLVGVLLGWLIGRRESSFLSGNTVKQPWILGNIVVNSDIEFES